MSTQPRRLSTALIVQLALFAPEYSFAGFGDGKETATTLDDAALGTPTYSLPRSRSRSHSGGSGDSGGGKGKGKASVSPTRNRSGAGTVLVMRERENGDLSLRHTLFPERDEAGKEPQKTSWDRFVTNGYTFPQTDLTYSTLSPDFSHEGWAQEVEKVISPDEYSMLEKMAGWSMLALTLSYLVQYQHQEVS